MIQVSRYCFFFLAFFAVNMAYATNFKVLKVPSPDGRLYFRTMDEDTAGNLLKSGFITPGTIIRVPDDFIVYDKSFQHMDLEYTLFRWKKREDDLTNPKSPNYQPGYQRSSISLDEVDGKPDDRTFFPVEIVCPSAKSRMAKGDGKVGSVTPGILVYVDLFEITWGYKDYDTRKLTSVEEVEDKDIPCQTSRLNASNLEFNLNSSGATATTPVPPPEAYDPNLVAQLPPNFLRNKDASCPRITIKDMYATLLEQIRQYPRLASMNSTGLDPSLLMGLISKETLGNCAAIGGEWNRSVSVGFMQINTRSASRGLRNICSPKQMNQLRKMDMAQLKKSFRCLRNPYYNIVEGVRIFSQKLDLLEERVPGFNQFGIVDQLRYAMSAYNGGEGHTADSIAIAMKMNLDPSKWGNAIPGFEAYRGRSKKNTRINVDYVDTIAGRQSVDGSYWQMWANAWTNYFSKQ